MEEKGGAELLVMTLMNMLRNCISQDGRLKMQVPDCAADRDSNTSYKVVHLHSEGGTEEDWALGEPKQRYYSSKKTPPAWCGPFPPKCHT